VVKRKKVGVDGKPAKKKSSSSNDSMTVVAIVGGSLAALLVLVGGIYAVTSSGMLSGSSEPKEVKLATFETARPVKEKTLVVMKWQMPDNWKMTESGIENGRWPWATLKTDRGDTVKLKHNRSLMDKAEGGGMASLLEDNPAALVRDAHHRYKINVGDEYSEFQETAEQTVPGKMYPVAFADFTYKGMLGTVHGIHMTTLGGIDPAIVWIECSENERDIYRPVLQQLAGSIEYYDPSDEEENKQIAAGGAGADDGAAGGDEMADEEMAAEPAQN
jgi:hypothetical protein